MYFFLYNIAKAFSVQSISIENKSFILITKLTLQGLMFAKKKKKLFSPSPQKHALSFYRGSLHEGGLVLTHER